MYIYIIIAFWPEIVKVNKINGIIMGIKYAKANLEESYI